MNGPLSNARKENNLIESQAFHMSANLKTPYLISNGIIIMTCPFFEIAAWSDYGKGKKTFEISSIHILSIQFEIFFSFLRYAGIWCRSTLIHYLHPRKWNNMKIKNSRRLRSANFLRLGKTCLDTGSIQEQTFYYK